MDNTMNSNQQTSHPDDENSSGSLMEISNVESEEPNVLDDVEETLPNKKEEGCIASHQKNLSFILLLLSLSKLFFDVFFTKFFIPFRRH